MAIRALVVNKEEDGPVSAAVTEITEAVSRVISRAQHAHLKEAEHQSIVRQLTAAVGPFFTPVTAEEPLFERVLLPKCAGHPTDF